MEGKKGDEQKRTFEIGSEAKEEKWEMKNVKGKGLHNNGKKSNVQILS